MEKICSRCNEIKTLEEFYKDKKGRLGRSSRCISCRKIIDKEYRTKNRDKETIRMQQWRKNNPIKSKAYSKKYREDNIEKIKKTSIKQTKRI